MGDRFPRDMSRESRWEAAGIEEIEEPRLQKVEVFGDNNDEGKPTAPTTTKNNNAAAAARTTNMGTQTHDTTSTNYTSENDLLNTFKRIEAKLEDNRGMRGAMLGALAGGTVAAGVAGGAAHYGFGTNVTDTTAIAALAFVAGGTGGAALGNWLATREPSAKK